MKLLHKKLENEFKQPKTNAQEILFLLITFLSLINILGLRFFKPDINKAFGEKMEKTMTQTHITKQFTNNQVMEIQLQTGN